MQVKLELSQEELEEVVARYIADERDVAQSGVRVKLVYRQATKDPPVPRQIVAQIDYEVAG